MEEGDPPSSRLRRTKERVGEEEKRIGGIIGYNLRKEGRCNCGILEFVEGGCRF